MIIEELTPIHTTIQDTDLLGMYFVQSPGSEDAQAAAKDELSRITGIFPGNFSNGDQEDTFGSYLSIRTDLAPHAANRILRESFPHSAINSANVRGEAYEDVSGSPVCENLIYRIGEPWQVGEVPGQKELSVVREIEMVHGVWLGFEGGNPKAVGGKPAENILRVATMVPTDLSPEARRDRLVGTAVEVASKTRLFLPDGPKWMNVTFHKLDYLAPSVRRG